MLDMLKAGDKTEAEKHYYSVGLNMMHLTPELCAEYVKKNIDPWCWCPDTEEMVLKGIACNSTLMTCNDPVPAIKIIKKKTENI